MIVVPEIADYEIRRELRRADKLGGVKRLDLTKATFAYLPITTAAMLRGGSILGAGPQNWKAYCQ